MKALTNQEIKNELVNMMIQLQDFLKENNIKYSITSGTLLGAVRHQGFIPWDDDIDISMLRPEYNKLINLLKQNNSINNTLKGFCFELGNGYLPYLKIINPKIVSEESVFEDIVDKGNLWIDVFPMDGIPNLFSKLYTKYIFNFQRKIYEIKRISIEFPAIFEKQKKPKLLFFIKNISYTTITKQYIKRCSRFNVNNCKYVSDYTWGNTIIPKEMMENLKAYNFENTTFMGIENSDGYLSKLYGNYMELPPVEKRINHGLKAWYVD